MKEANYVAWQIRESEFPINEPIEQKILFLVKYGVLAPSTHNTQPWNYEIQDNKLMLEAKPDLRLPEADPKGRNLEISLGCFVTNIIIASQRFNLSAECHWSGSKIILIFNSRNSKTNGRLTDAIVSRYSDKMPYDSKDLEPEHLTKLLKVEAPPGCELNIVIDRQQIKKIATAHRATILDYAKKPAFFKELSQWMRPSNTKSEDGMPGFVVGLSAPQSQILRRLIQKAGPIVKVLAKKDHKAIISSSAVGFITSKNRPQDWFNCGLFYESLALEATANAMVMTPMAAMIEEPNHLNKLAKRIGLKDNPQIFFRLGYSKHKPYHTPRRGISSIFMETQQKLAKIIDSRIDIKQMKIGRYSISYIVAGKGQPLVLLHGANIGWPQWYKNINALAKHYKVYAIDLPGAGSSTKIDFHKADFEEFVDIADKFIKLNKLSKVDIIGSSFGGWIALRLAIQRKPYIKRIVLTNPLGFTNYLPPKFRPIKFRPLALFVSKTALRPARSNKNLEKFMRDVFYDKHLHLAPEFIDYFYELSKTSHNLLFINRLSRGIGKELFLKAHLPKIDKPLMVVWGKEDALMPFSTVIDQIKLIPGVQLEVLENIGHMPPVEAAEKFNKLAIKFLKSKT